MIRLYLIPITHLTNYNVPSYLSHRFNLALSGLEGIPWAWVTYLLEDIGLIIADTDATQHALLSAQTGVLAVPALDNTIPNTTVRNQVRNALEVVNIPGLWVTTGMSYRAIVRIVLGIFHYHNRLTVLVQRRIFDGSINLDMAVNQIPAGVRVRWQQAAEDLNLDYSAVTGTTTIRQLLKGMGDQFANQEHRISGAGLEMVI